MTTRYYSLTACEHGEWNVHALEPGILNEDGSLDRDKVCPGGQRRELTGVEVVYAAELSWFGVDGLDWFGAVAPMPKSGRYAIIPLEEPQAWTELEDGRLVLDPDGSISRGEEPADG